MMTEFPWGILDLGVDAMNPNPDKLLRLLHLCDSALPIGATAHSFGLETLVYDEELGVHELEAHFTAVLQESGVLEATYLRHAYRLGGRVTNAAGRSAQNELATWHHLNRRLAARKPAREIRDADHTLGRRLYHLARSLDEDTMWGADWDLESGGELHLSTVFGLTGGLWALDEEATTLGFLQQSLAGMIAGCQRLMALGQVRAQQTAWRLKPCIADVVEQSRCWANGEDDPPAFLALLELGGMRHPGLPVRLFVS